MVSGEFPARTILVSAQSMAACQMPPQRQAAPAAFEANDIIAVNRSPDRYGGRPLSLGFGCWFSERGKRPMHSRDQHPELIGPDLVSPNVRGDDVGREFSTK